MVCLQVLNMMDPIVTYASKNPFMGLAGSVQNALIMTCVLLAIMVTNTI